MSLQKLIVNYAEFNLWANKTYAAWLKTKSDELLEKKVASSYPSIMLTVKHIWDTERFWLSILKDEIPGKFTQDFKGSNLEAFEGFINQSDGFSKYVNSLSEDKLIAESKLDMPWLKGLLPRYEFIQHCLNHSTYHRGQIVTIGRNIGIIDPPMTDYNYYNMAIKPI